MSGPGRVALVGAGPGDPGLLTVRGLALIRAADVIVHDRLVDPALLDEAPGAERIAVGNRPGAPPDWQAGITPTRFAQARRGGLAGRRRAGDPSAFGRAGG